jgi:ribosomal-protein-alanine N-acetyltransferase
MTINLPHELKTSRLLLRPYHLDDVEDIMEFANNPEWSRYIPVAQPYTHAEATRYILQFVEMASVDGKGYAITHHGKVLGGIRVRFFLHERRAEIGYSIAPEYWRKGFALEALRVVLATLFDAVAEIEKICANVAYQNQASRALLEKIGFKPDTAMTASISIRGDFLEGIKYCILRSEWQR